MSIANKKYCLRHTLSAGGSRRLVKRDRSIYCIMRADCVGFLPQNALRRDCNGYRGSLLRGCGRSIPQPVLQASQ